MRNVTKRKSGKSADDPIFDDGIVLYVPELADNLPMCVKAFGLALPIPIDPPLKKLLP